MKTVRIYAPGGHIRFEDVAEDVVDNTVTNTLTFRYQARDALGAKTGKDSVGRFNTSVIFGYSVTEE